ncbi:hypothetical protein [Rhodococcus sp. NPDC060176]|uniref:hypothetical protein n=1 Tax=Rhodococcus sp. NPDC060176 TaxID=3347062 RepID=UPI003664B18C
MNDLFDYLVTQLDRPVRQEEVATVLKLSRASVGRRIKEGFPVDEILAVLDHYELSRASGLINIGILDTKDVVDAIGSEGLLVDTSSDYELARELAMRANPALAAKELPAPNAKPATVHQIRPWEVAPDYDPNEKPDFSVWDAASHREKQTIDDPEGDYS